MPSAPAAIAWRPSSTACFAVSDVHPMTTVARPATWSIAVSATRRRSSGVCENHSPVVPLTKIPCMPSPTYHSTSARSESRSSAPPVVKGVGQAGQ